MLILTNTTSAEFKQEIPRNELFVLLKPSESITEITLNDAVYKMFSNRVLPNEYHKQGYVKAQRFLQVMS